MADISLHEADADQAAIDANIAAQEEAARDYKPDVNGPGINELHSTEEIRDYYASADQTLAEKTANLPQAYPLYRAVRGDGNCGWRATGFCYFEALIHNGDADLIVREKTRLLELNGYIREVGGYDPYVYEDMVEETEILFGAILNTLPDAENAIRVLTEAFNDEAVSNAIIYHLRLLAASYLKGNVETYEGFITHDGGVVGYCQDWIERPNCEIDHLRLELLASVLLKPSDIVLEIAYLDRSHGSKVTVYKFPEENNSRPEETVSMHISLLFRPDHYDILYRPSMPSEAAAKAALLSFASTSADMAAFQPSDSLQNGALPEQQTLTDTEDISVQNFAAPTSYYDLMAQQANAPFMQDNTTGLTPGSSSESPCPIPVMEEPATPAYISPAPFGAAPQHTVTEEKDSIGQSAATSVAASAPNSIDATNSGTGITAGQSPALFTSSTTFSAATPHSVHDREVHFVGPISYNHASQSMNQLDNFSSTTPSNFQLLSHHLPGMFGRFQSQPMSPFPLSRGSSASWHTGALLSTKSYEKVSPSYSSPRTPASGTIDMGPCTSTVALSASPVLSVGTDAPVAAEKVAKEQNESSAEPISGIAKASLSMMYVSMQVPEAAVSHIGMSADTHDNSGDLNVNILPEPKSTPVRFTKWHFNRLPHAVTDPNSSMFRNSRGSTAHFGNPDFQPQEYDPSAGGADTPGSRNRRKSSVIREVEKKS
ncbi:hypothetical protein SEPCBS119000_003581 [Sporothrix epigloea]|uniref:ubiquitinyl hydrolase 1 n=1 Tax=Sporothrix epigloea TaxID=1892477 RepID=A0ABP0DMF5_9PEZI